MAFGERLRELLLLAAIAIVPQFLAFPAAARSGNVLIVHNDRGGVLTDRAHKIESLAARGTAIELRGPLCISACTMYLGAPNVCVSPTATFGFHGPSFSGQAMPTAEFERWSQFMAKFYNEPLRVWFLRTGRYRQIGYYSIKGSELIRLGYQSC